MFYENIFYLIKFKKFKIYKKSAQSADFLYNAVLFSNTKLRYDFFIAFWIFSFEVWEHFSSFCYHSKNSFSRMFILFMFSKMFFEVFNFCAENSNLYFRRPSIYFASCKFFYDLFFVLFTNWHRVFFYNINHYRPEKYTSSYSFLIVVQTRYFANKNKKWYFKRVVM